MPEKPPSNTAVILRIVTEIEKKLDDFETRIRALETAAIVAFIVRGI